MGGIILRVKIFLKEKDSFIADFNIRKNYNPSHKQICGVKLTKTQDTCVRYNPETRQLQFNN